VAQDIIIKMAKVRNFLMTLNNPDDDTRTYLERLHVKSNAVYTCGQLEKGEEGTPHI